MHKFIEKIKKYEEKPYVIKNFLDRKEIADFIGCDKIFYQELDDLINAVKSESSKISNFDSSCFNGNYITGDVNEDYLIELDKLRNDAEKYKKTQSENTFDEVVVY